MSEPQETTFLPDASAMVAAVCAWHERHAASLAELERRLDRGETMLVAAPALVESYSVLTRLPAPHRISPADALAVLEASFMRPHRAIALTVSGYLDLLRSAPTASVFGGRTYDAVIAACAKQEQVAALVTFNEAAFRSLLADASVEIVVPSAGERG